MFSQQETRSAERIRRPAVHLLETVPGPDEEDAAVSPPALEAVDWEVLAPQGWYARIGQPIFQLLLLVATLPFVLLVAVPIALTNWVVFRDPRRILYRQPRVGHRGRIFHMYKFRTMREMPSDAFSSWRQDQDDLRVTRFGRFLRNAQLDELPQFLNILRGEMVLIGPRPEMVEIDAWARERVPGFHRRLAIKPGITGRSQITQGYTGMDVREYAEKLRGDERYRESVNLREDLEILVRTVMWMLRGRGWRWHRSLAAAEPCSRESEAA